MIALRLGRRALVGSICICLSAASLLPAVAVACEGKGPVLSGEKDLAVPLPKEVKLKGGFTEILEYRQNGGPAKTGALSVKTEGEFEDNGSTCETANLADKGQCQVILKCKKDLAKGKVEVVGTEPGITWWKRSLECV